MPDIPGSPKFKAWTAPPSTDWRDIVRAYEEGMIGAAEPTPAQLEEFHDAVERAGGYKFASDACYAFKLAGKAPDLCLPWLNIVEIYPGCYPGMAQIVGSCVSHNLIKALMTSYGSEIAAGIPDPVTGLIEGPPEISAEGVRAGAFAPEALWMTRGYSGSGWQCPVAGRNSIEKIGLAVRKAYPDLGIDLTRVTRETEGLYGGKAPEKAIQVLGQNRPRTATQIDSSGLEKFEICMDLWHAGYGIQTCGSEGWSSERDENGVSRRRGSWAHAMAAIGGDRRPAVVAKYGEPLVLNLNSWGPNWNSGPRDIMQSAEHVPPAKREAWIAAGIVNSATGNIMIPEGSYWSRWSDYQRRYMAGISNTNGWPMLAAPDLGATGRV